MQYRPCPLRHQPGLAQFRHEAALGEHHAALVEHVGFAGSAKPRNAQYLRELPVGGIGETQRCDDAARLVGDRRFEPDDRLRGGTRWRVLHAIPVEVRPDEPGPPLENFAQVAKKTAGRDSPSVMLAGLRRRQSPGGIHDVEARRARATQHRLQRGGERRAGGRAPQLIASRVPAARQRNQFRDVTAYPGVLRPVLDMRLAIFDPELKRVGLGFEHRVEPGGTRGLQRLLDADIHPGAEGHQAGNRRDRNEVERRAGRKTRAPRSSGAAFPVRNGRRRRGRWGRISRHDRDDIRAIERSLFLPPGVSRPATRELLAEADKKTLSIPSLAGRTGRPVAVRRPNEPRLRCKSL